MGVVEQRLGAQDTAWRERAACKGADPDQFYVSNGVWGSRNHTKSEQQVIERFCDRCPVRAECLDFALETNQDYGIWGGTTENERVAIRREMRKQGRR